MPAAGAGATTFAGVAGSDPGTRALQSPRPRPGAVPGAQEDAAKHKMAGLGGLGARKFHTLEASANFDLKK